MSNNNTEKKSSGWKYVVLGEIPGVMMGIAGTIMAAEHLAAQTIDPNLPAEPGKEPLVPVAEVDDEMSFADAFAAARSQVGAGGVFAWRGNVYNTFYKEEWEGMSDEQKEEFVENYRNTEVERPEYDLDDETSEDYEDNEFEDGDEEFELEELEIATVSDTDNMSFSEAFAAARAEVGSGGIFEWNGNYYNTFYKEEWDAMTDRQKVEFMRQFHNTELPQDPDPITEPQNPVTITPVEPEPIEVEVISVERVAFDDGTIGTVASVEVNGYEGLMIDNNDDGAADVIAVDLDGDGQFTDSEILYVQDESIQMPDDLVSGDNTGEVSGGDYSHLS